jgi:hypothetical protein
MSTPNDMAAVSDGSHGSSHWTPRILNDAVLIPFASEARICRVVAITEDGRCVVDVGLRYGEVLKVEHSPGEWPKVGCFVQGYGGFIQSIFGPPSWKFVPSS